jgi:quercetin dioxygenase-like cupin family protein
MAQVGETMRNPVTGVRIRFLHTAEETDGEFVEADCFWPRKPRPDAGIHPGMQERIEVISGELEFWLDGDRRTLRPGEEAIVVPAGTPHCGWNAIDEEVHFRLRFEPALRWEFFIEKLFALTREGRTDEEGDLSPEELERFLAEFEQEILPAPSG